MCERATPDHLRTRFSGDDREVVCEWPKGVTMLGQPLYLNGLILTRDLASLPYQISGLMDKFESQFETMDVQTAHMEETMGNTTTLTTPQVGPSARPLFPSNQQPFLHSH